MSSNYRTPYTRQEDQIIVNYVKEHPRDWKGITIWKNLVKDTGLDRPWLSVQCRFAKFIMPYIRDKNIFPNVTDEEAQMMLKSFYPIKITPVENNADRLWRIWLAESKSDASSKDDAANETRNEPTADESDSPKGDEIDDSDTTVLMSDRERDVGFDTVVRRGANKTDRDSVTFMNLSAFSRSTVKLNDDTSARRSVDLSDFSIAASRNENDVRTEGARHRTEKNISRKRIVETETSSSDDSVVFDIRPKANTKQEERTNKKDHHLENVKKIISRERIVEAETSSSDDSVVFDIRPKANTKQEEQTNKKGSSRGNTKENVSDKTSTNRPSLDLFKYDETDDAARFLQFDHSSSLRKKYTLDEDLVIIKCILRSIRYNPRFNLFGGAIFKEIESKKILDRTWQSLKTRFRKHIFPNLDRYNLPAKKVDVLKSYRKR